LRKYADLQPADPWRDRQPTADFAAEPRWRYPPATVQGRKTPALRSEKWSQSKARKLWFWVVQSSVSLHQVTDSTHLERKFRGSGHSCCYGRDIPDEARRSVAACVKTKTLKPRTRPTSALPPLWDIPKSCRFRSPPNECIPCNDATSLR
jgi:hypothetical protein